MLHVRHIDIFEAESYETQNKCINSRVSYQMNREILHKFAKGKDKIS